MSSLDFQAAMQAAGLHSKAPVIADGTLRRFHVCGDAKGSKNGWYVFFGHAGSFGSWRTGEKITWHAGVNRTQTAQDKQRIQDAMYQHKAAQQKRAAAARDKAAYIWDRASLAHTHPYLTSKGVGAHGLRRYKDALVIPLRDIYGTLHSLQFIDAQGNKRFLSGGRKKACFHLMGRITQGLYIAEGYATAASIHEATGMPCAVAFDAGNLEPVARALHARYPALVIVICGDDDSGKTRNTGRICAYQAALAVNGLVSMPEEVS